MRSLLSISLSMAADALGTTLFVLGPKAGMKFIDSWDGAAALFVVRQPDGSFQKLPSSRFEKLTAPSDEFQAERK